MDDQAIIAALRAKSDSHFTELAELDRKREETAAKISGLHKALRSLDGRFNGPTEVREILRFVVDYKPRPLVTLKRRELLKRACQVLQSAPEPMKTDEIADRIAPDVNIAADDEASQGRLRRDLTGVLAALKKQGIVKAERPEGRRNYRWSIARPFPRAA